MKTLEELAHSLPTENLYGLQYSHTHKGLMKLNFRQLTLLSIALTLFYDEACKKGITSGMRKDLIELSKLVNDEFSKVSA